MPAAAPAPFEDLSPLVFGDHALNLERCSVPSQIEIVVDRAVRAGLSGLRATDSRSTERT